MIKKINQIEKNERKALWTLAVTSQCRIIRTYEINNLDTLNISEGCWSSLPDRFLGDGSAKGYRPVIANATGDRAHTFARTHVTTPQSSQRQALLISYAQ
jgi:hypothetical protein